MTTLREAAQQALKALGLWATGRDMDAVALNDLIFRLEAALAESVQEPVAWMHTNAVGHVYFRKKPQDRVFNPQPLYTAPPQRKPLTDEKVCDLWSWSMTAEAERTATTQQHAFARAIERAHGIGEKE